MRTAAVVIVVLVGAWGVTRWRARRWLIVERTKVLDQVASAFRFLEVEHQMRRVTLFYDERSFGNVIAEYERPGMWFQLVRDRSQWFFSVGPSESRAVTENQILPLFGARGDLDLLIADRWSSLDLTADVVKRNFARFIDDAERRGAKTSIAGAEGA